MTSINHSIYSKKQQHMLNKLIRAVCFLAPTTGELSVEFSVDHDQVDAFVSYIMYRPKYFIEQMIF